jgi:hypothetical protein
MNIKRVQTLVRLEYDNDKVIVQQTNWQPTKGVPGANPLQMVIALLRQQHQALTQALQTHGLDGMYKRSQVTLHRMQHAKRRANAKRVAAIKSASVVESSPGETTDTAGATGE